MRRRAKPTQNSSGAPHNRATAGAFWTMAHLHHKCESSPPALLRFEFQGLRGLWLICVCAAARRIHPCAGQGQEHRRRREKIHPARIRHTGGCGDERVYTAHTHPDCRSRVKVGYHWEELGHPGHPLWEREGWTLLSQNGHRVRNTARKIGLWSMSMISERRERKNGHKEANCII